MLDYKIESDIRTVRTQLDRMAMDTPKLRKTILSKILQRVKSYVIREQLRGQALHRITGELAKSIKYKVYKEANEVTNYNKEGHSAYIISKLMWSGTHEYGLEKTSKTGRRMSMPLRPFLEPAVMRVFAGGEAETIGQEQIEKWLQEHSK